MNIQRQTAREFLGIFPSNYDICKDRFDQELLKGGIDAQIAGDKLIAVSGLKFQCPVVALILNDRLLVSYINGYKDYDNLFIIENDFVRHFSGSKENQLPAEIALKIIYYANRAQNFGGRLNEKGEHIFDITVPPISPHFAVNLLLGNRIGYEYPLQTTPKAVVDWLGRGSFRSHSATQVTAARWDMRPEENGNPVNRQFYIIEDGKRIFYSADVNTLEGGHCIHSQNHTVITYKTKCGLEITNTIFIVPQIKGLPQAIETQRIVVKNTLNQDRNLKIVFTGIFGTPAEQALVTDVVYSTVIMESETIYKDNKLAAFSSHYYPSYFKEDKRFVTLSCQGQYFDEFCADYTAFVGKGSIEYPQNLNFLNCKHNTKGPAFFALGKSFGVKANDEINIDVYTGAVSCKGNESEEKINQLFDEQVGALLDEIIKPDFWCAMFDKVKAFYRNFSSYLQVNTDEPNLNAYLNNNLPFQTLYQTFVSRSFAQTQKGFREIGFREIQDIYASMYYMAAMDNPQLIRELVTQWANNVYEMGYANHNFFWKGKEPGICSDDGLWLAPAVYRYITLTGDIDFLNQECKIAASDKRRTLYQTLKAIIQYSGEISIGKNGFPLLDRSDWNDCLKLDDNWLDGPTKEKLYYEQLKAKGQPYGVPFENDLCESVMNLFLLIITVDYTLQLARKINDQEYAQYLQSLLNRLREGAHKKAWKGDFFARVMINRFEDGKYTYLGAKGDGLSNDPNIDGTYFLNSFSWSILSQTATEDQIKTMLDPIKKYLMTEAGLKLNTLADLERLAYGTASGHYFPGDRENGGVFKHATMMATCAMLQAAKQVKSEELANELTELCEYMLDRVLPYKTLKNPFVLKGNPRFCTQYNNSQTNENVGPIVSGTASWLTLTLFEMFGLNVTTEGIELNPMLLKSMDNADITLKIRGCQFDITIKKSKKGFCRVSDATIIKLNGKEHKGAIPLDLNQKNIRVEILV
ncbi:MAG TPA: glycosyl transferase [Clostridiales bacterium]|nr:glycosyl transferase [Clostridiales bacterium]